VISLRVAVLGVRPEEHAVAPHLLLRLRVEEQTGAALHALALRLQLRLEPRRRGYAPEEREALTDLFGPPEAWPAALHSFTWAHTCALLPGFTGTTEVEVPVPVTYDFEVAASRYLHALRDGEVPLSVLLSGTAFSRGAAGFQVEPVPWSSEASYRMPVSTWHDLLAVSFPGTGWVRLAHGTVAALARVRRERGLTSWDDTVAALLPEGALR